MYWLKRIRGELGGGPGCGKRWPIAVVLGAGVALSGVASASDEIVGVDFDNGAGSPTNWNTFSGPTPGTLSNLIDEAGVATNYSFTMNVGSGFSTSINPATIPQHTNPLDGLDDYYWSTTLTGTGSFNNLTPGQNYYVWVFGLRLPNWPINNAITIEGGDAPIQFNQFGTGNDLWVNDSRGDSGQTLHSFAVMQSANVDGAISLTFDFGPGATIWTIGGVAIQPEPGADCPPDWNGDGVVDSDDLFDFLADWAAGNADYNGDGVTDSDDLFEFLADWANPGQFPGCD